MDRMQISLKLGLDILGIPVKIENYRKICNAVYEAEQRGVHISSSTIYFDEKEGIAYSPMSHETSDFPSKNLLTDVCDLKREIDTPLDYSKNYKLDDVSIRKLKKLKEDLENGIKENI